MAPIFDEELLACFLDEATDTLGQWERACLDIESGESVDLYQALFRAAHNLKGASRSVGLIEFGALVHIAEDVISLLIKDELTLYPGLVSILLECQIFLSEWVNRLRDNPIYVPDSRVLVKRLELLGQRPSLREKEASPQSSSPHVHDDSFNSASSAPDELELLFKRIQDEVSGNSATNSSTADAREGGAERPSESSDLPSLSSQPIGSERGKTSRADETVRVAASKLDELIQLIGELTIHQSILFQGRRSGNLHDTFYQNAIQLSHKITKDIHGKALSLRMQPVQSLFQRIERVAKDVARSEGKLISVSLQGTDVELDKTVIEKITDPLVHIVRNAVDHGIEPPHERQAIHKEQSAKVTISATQDAGSVRLTISDDGKGLSGERILKKAIEKGLISQTDKLSQKEVHNLIFLPGFSTAEQVTEISGRGVGMDVVMKAVQALQGTIDLTSKEGRGTTFAITLPASMSIVEGLVVKVRDLRYVVAMHELTEIIDLSDYPLESTGNQSKMISLRGTVIPLKSLKEYVTISRCQQQADADEMAPAPALVVREGSSLIAFRVDQILGQQSVVIRPLNDQMSKLPGFSGSTILGDGEPGMILSLGDLARNYFSHVRRAGVQQ